MKPRRAQEDHTSPAFTETTNGLVPAFGSTNGYYLRDDGVWAPAPGAFDWIPDVERRDYVVTGAAYPRGMGAFSGGSGISNALGFTPGGTGIERVPSVGIRHTLVGLGTRWTGWSAARPGPLSTHRGFWAEWLFGGWGTVTTTTHFWTGLKDATGSNITSSCRMVGVSRYVDSTYMAWTAAPSSTTFQADGGGANTAGNRDADDVDHTDTTWVFDPDEVYKLTLSTDPGEGDVHGVLYRFSDGAELTHTFDSSVVPVGYKLGPWMTSNVSTTARAFCMANVRTRAGLADGLS